MGENMEVNSIAGLTKPQGNSTIVLDLEDDAGKIHNLNFKNFYYFPGAPKILVVPQKWAWYREESEVIRKRTYLKVMVKFYILVWNNGKSQITILHNPIYVFP